MGRLRLSAAAAALLLVNTGCLRLSLEREKLGRPLAQELHHELLVEEVDLHDCLTALGAPVYVWEVNGGEYGLAYGWNRDLAWSFNISVPLTRGASASFDFESLDQRLNGVVLIFDAQDRLLHKRTGFLSEILTEAQRRRPALLPPSSESEDDSSGGENDSSEGGSG